jgi:hypothetical protein
VLADGDTIGTGVVSLFSVDTIPPYVPYIAVSLLDSSGTYHFYGVPDGDYYIHAIPIGVPGYLPTFYGDVIFWEDATVVHLGNAVNPYNINLVHMFPFVSGGGGINGQISYAGLKSTLLDKVTMLLMNSEGKAVSFGPVSGSGEFGFAGLAYGTWYLKGELAGVTSDLVRVDITAANPNPSVTMTFTGASILGIGSQPALVNSWAVFPNPVSDRLTVSIDLKQKTDARVQIFNLAGQAVKSMAEILVAGTNTVVIATDGLPAGIYTLRITSPEGINLNAKVVKTK